MDARYGEVGIMVITPDCGSGYKGSIPLLHTNAPLRKLAKRLDLGSSVSEFDSLGEYQLI